MIIIVHYRAYNITIPCDLGKNEEFSFFIIVGNILHSDVPEEILWH